MHYYFAVNKKHETFVVVETDINNVSRWVKDLLFTYELLPDTFDQCGVLISMK